MIKIYRHTYNTVGDRNIIGDLHYNNRFFCYTLEDEIRANGVKKYGITCIPAGIYECEVTMSPKFKRNMILIKDVPMFSGIRIHGGNTSKDTLGCPLVAYHTDYKRIWKTAEKELTNLVLKNGGKDYISIINAPISYNRFKHIQE